MRDTDQGRLLNTENEPEAEGEGGEGKAGGGNGGGHLWGRALGFIWKPI